MCRPMCVFDIRYHSVFVCDVWACVCVSVCMWVGCNLFL